MLHHLTEIKIINLQGAKFKDTPPPEKQVLAILQFLFAATRNVTQ